MPTDPTPGETDPILFFDGVCGLCNTFVDFILKYERSKTIRFSPLQGDLAEKLTTEADRADLNSVVFAYNGSTYRKSAAIVRVMWEMGFPWTWLGSLLWIIPAPLRDLGYRIVARSRYALFGKKESCRMPTPDERARFYD